MSFGGMLRLHTCAFEDVVSRKMVSTTANNYIRCAGDPVSQSVDLSDTPQAIFFNYEADDDSYDIVPVADGSDGSLSAVEDAVMSLSLIHI